MLELSNPTQILYTTVMEKEFETKVLVIDKNSIINKLRTLKTKEFTEVLMRRYVFDYDSKDTEFLRLREYDGKTELTYKHKKANNTEIGNTIEINVETSDFEKTAEILLKLNFKRVFYQENKRHKFVYMDIEFTIDTWPMLAPLLEIEAKSMDKITEGLQLLDLEGKDCGDKDMKSIYKDQGIDIHSFKELKFSP